MLRDLALSCIQQGSLSRGEMLQNFILRKGFWLQYGEIGRVFSQRNHLRDRYSSPSKKWCRPALRQEQWDSGEKESGVRLSAWLFGPGGEGEGSEGCQKFLASKTGWIVIPFTEID